MMQNELFSEWQRKSIVVNGQRTRAYDIRAITLEQFRLLIACGNDSRNNQIRVTKSGMVYLSEDIVGLEQLDDMALSFETFHAGGGYVGVKAAEQCGVKVNRNGMAVCPFHKDKNPSMKIDSRYYCFGCGEKGDAIDFVAKFYGLGKKEAALQIAADFGISFEDKKGKKPPPKRKRKLSPEQRFERAEKKCFRVLSDYLCCLREWQEKYAPCRAEEEWNPLFCEALEKKDYIEYLLDILLYAPIAERVELVTDYGEEVLKIERRMEQLAAGAEGSTGKDNGKSRADSTAGNMV